MPAGVKKVGNKWAIYNKDTGKIYGYSDTETKAQKSANARNAGSHGWNPSRQKKKVSKKRKVKHK